MKGFVLASLFSVGYAAAILAIFAVAVPENRAAVMTRLCLALLPVLALCVAVTPPDLGVLPAWLVEENRLLDIGFSLVAFAASVFGGWLQLYNLADRGLSLRILIDASEAPDGLVSVDRVRSGYGAGKGIQWMYGKRVADLLRLGLIRRDGGDYVLAASGRRSALLIRNLRRLYTIGVGEKPGRC